MSTEEPLVESRTDRLWVHPDTLACAYDCLVCAYRVACFDVRLDSDFCRRHPNQRPELCRRTHVPELWEFQNTHTLIVGDGDLSFSRSIASLGGPVMATSYEPKDVVLDTYPLAKEHMAGLEAASNAKLQFQVDATKLPDYFEPDSFDRVVFNFPCTNELHGQDGQNQEMERNNQLIRDFLEAARRIRIPQIMLLHKTKPPYDQWKIPPPDYRIVLDRNLFEFYIPRKARDRKSFPCHDAVWNVYGARIPGLVRVNEGVIQKLRAHWMARPNKPSRRKRKRR